MYKVTKSGNDQYYLEKQLTEGLTRHAHVFHLSTLATQSMVFRWQPGIRLFFSNFGGSWGTEEQVDLEWFDTETFFGVLLRQSLSVTTKLSQTKEELKLLCLKLVSEVHSLRQLWGAERGIPASTDQILGSPQKERQQAAEAAARAAEEEARQREHLAGEYAACLSYQLKLLRQDLHARQDQWASFCSALMAAQRLLKAQTGSRPKKSSQTGQNPKGEVPQLDAVLGHLSWALLQEGHRLKAWGILGTGTGAELLRPGEPFSVSARAPRKPGPAFRVTGLAVTRVPPSRHSAGEEGRTKQSGNPQSGEGLPVQCSGQVSV
nr:PREDICTED: uncharacterized protein LOC109436582 [Rhinolophus sinicus]